MRNALLFIMLCSLSACFTSKRVAAPVTKQTFTFDYSPKESAKPGSTPFVVAIVKPRYAKTFSTASSELFTLFQTALGSDIEELLIAKGVTLRGPYEAFGEMAYEDKKRTDLAFEIEIAPEFAAKEGGWKERYHYAVITGWSTYSYKAVQSLVGKITITGYEPLTHEKVWVKSVSIPSVENITLTSANSYDAILQESELLDKDPGVYNALGKALETQYRGIMEKIAAHFSPEEFLTLKGQIKELKAKKGF